MPGWCLFIVMAREFAVTGLRLIAANTGRVIAAGWSGKIKTASTMVCLCLVMFFSEAPFLSANALRIFENVCLGVILTTTISSGVEYFAKNRDVFKGQM